jgi:hypothetical protein
MQKSRLDIEFNDALVESIDETITELLGRTVLNALYAHLETNYSISRNELPHRLDTLTTPLQRVFGVRSSQTITRAIAKKFYLKLRLEFTADPTCTLLEYVDEAKMNLQASQTNVG